jgi:shikimate dehydrogenase
MDLYGLTGKKLIHSFSPDYFKKKFEEEKINADYRLFELDDIRYLPELIRKHPNLKGLNVTVPYKKEVLQFLDWLDAPCRETGAVNTIRISGSGEKRSLSGYNTDIIGFEKAILPFVGSRRYFNALVLGTGGSAEAVAYVLNKIGVSCLFISRNPLGENRLAYEEIDEQLMERHQMIINTTPLGMYPNVNDLPDIPYHLITKNHLLIDLIYNPEETSFLKMGKSRGAKIANGLKMLHYQAEESWKIWNAE